MKYSILFIAIFLFSLAVPIQAQDDNEERWDPESTEWYYPQPEKVKSGDCQLHIEFKSPDPENFNGQNRGNSGIFLPGGYEVQVLDGDQNPTYVNGMVGSIYKQQAPSVNAYSKNGE